VNRVLPLELPVPTVEQDLKAARETIRNVVAAFRLSSAFRDDDLTRRQILQQASRMHSQLAVNAGRRGRSARA